MEDRYLSVEDVMNISEKPFNVVKFADLKNYRNLDELFEPVSMGMKYAPVDDVLILYEAQPNSGHWCTLKRLPTEFANTYSYHFLDPYGEVIDGQRKYINPTFRLKSGQNTPLILKKLYEQMEGGGGTDLLDIHYNDKVLQGTKTSTCGRYAGMFIRFDEPVEKYAKTLMKMAKKKNISVDNLIIQLTAKLLDRD